MAAGLDHHCRAGDYEEWGHGRNSSAYSGMITERNDKLRSKFLSQITKEKLGGSLKESFITS